MDVVAIVTNVARAIIAAGYTMGDGSAALTAMFHRAEYKSPVKTSQRNVLNKLRQCLAGYRIPELGPAYEGRDQAAVLVPIIDGPEPSLVLTLRAGTLNSHGGEVAWPGGKQDPEDASLTATALRETHEEIALHPDLVEIVGELRPFISKHGLLVTPVVGIFPRGSELRPNPGELDAIFDVPVRWLADDPRSATDLIERHGESHRVPSYEYEGHRIWGLTAMILKELLVHGFEFDIR